MKGEQRDKSNGGAWDIHWEKKESDDLEKCFQWNWLAEFTEQGMLCIRFTVLFYEAMTCTDVGLGFVLIDRWERKDMGRWLYLECRQSAVFGDVQHIQTELD